MIIIYPCGCMRMRTIITFNLACLFSIFHREEIIMFAFNKSKRSTRLLLVTTLSASLIIGGCSSKSKETSLENTPATAAVQQLPDLSKVNSYLIDKATALHS